MKMKTSVSNKQKGMYYTKKLFGILSNEVKHWKKHNDLSSILEQIKVASKTSKDFAVNTANLFMPTNQEKLNNMLGKIKFVNTLNERYVALEEELNTFAKPFNNLLEIKSEYEEIYRNIEKNTTKESMKQTIEVKAKLRCTQEEINEIYKKREEISNEMTKIKKTYLKEYSNLKKLLSNKENVALLTAREQRLNRLSRMLDVNTTFEDAVDRFTVTLYEIIDSSDENMVGNELVQVYEEKSVIESKFDLNGTTFLVSISSINDSIKIGVLKDQKAILIGSGFSFYEIHWNQGYSNDLIVDLYNRLKTLKKDLHYKNSLRKHVSNLKPQTI